MKLHLKENFYQIEALVIKDLKLQSRFKFKFLFTVVAPFTTFLVPLLVFRTLFQAIGSESFGIWNPENYILFILTGIFITMLIRLLPAYGKSLLKEKYWKTLPGLFMCPMNIYNLLISKLISELVVFIIPLIVLTAFCFIIAEASLITIIFVIIIYSVAAVFMASIGLIIGAFRMSLEGGYSVFFNITNFFLIFSCYKYPREFFPLSLEFLIIWNPFYYFWEMIRLLLVLGVENVLFNPAYNVYFIIIFSLSLICPIGSVLFFNYMFKKYGLTGY